MIKFIEGEPYNYQGSSAFSLIYLRPSKMKGTGIFKSLKGDLFHYQYEKMVSCTKPEPQYPNPPHKHCAMICHVANGGVVKNITLDCIIEQISDCVWYINDEFEIVQPKTEDELRVEKRIEVLEKRLRKDQQEIDFTKKELARLNPTVHY